MFDSFNIRMASECSTLQIVCCKRLSLKDSSSRIVLYLQVFLSSASGRNLQVMANVFAPVDALSSDEEVDPTPKPKAKPKVKAEAAPKAKGKATEKKVAKAKAKAGSNAKGVAETEMEPVPKAKAKGKAASLKRPAGAAAQKRPATESEPGEVTVTGEVAHPTEGKAAGGGQVFSFPFSFKSSCHCFVVSLHNVLIADQPVLLVSSCLLSLTSIFSMCVLLACGPHLNLCVID